MKNLIQGMKAFFQDQRGLETVEWAVLAALIVAGLVGVITGVGSNVVARFTDLQGATAKP